MASRLPDFSHLTPDERIELAEQLWDSLGIEEEVGPNDEKASELRRRRAALESDGKAGQPWTNALDEIGVPGAD